MASAEAKTKRLEIPLFEGVNTIVGDNLTKKGELSHVENARSSKVGVISKREGVKRLGDDISATANYGITFFENSGNNGFYRLSTVSGVTSLYYLSGAAIWTALAGSGTNLSAVNASFVNANGNLIMVNGTDVNRYVTSNGTTVQTSALATGILYNSPKAFKVNFYKDRIYLADFYNGANRFKNGIQRSSPQLGIVALLTNDYDAGVTSLTVTSTKYIHATDSLDVYRGGTKIETLTISAKTEDTITVNATSNALQSADELWVAGTYGGSKVYRWVSNSPTGENVKEYDTMYLSGGQNNSITILDNIADIMLIANKNNMAVWNDYNLNSFDIGIGCVSPNGYVKTLGAIWFVHYTGIYSTNGSLPRLMSAKVQRYFDGATKSGLESSAVGKKGTSIFFAIGDVTLYNNDGSTYKTLSDVCLEYNLRQDNWYVHTGIDAKFFATYIASNNPDRLEYAQSSGDYNILELFNTEEQEGSQIPFRIDLDNIILARNFENFCYLKRIIIEVERGSGIQCFISVDNNDFYQIQGEASKGVVTLRVTEKDAESNAPVRCRKVKISLRDYTTKLCTISRIALIYTETTEEEIKYDQST